MSIAPQDRTQVFPGRLAHVYSAWTKFVNGEPIAPSKHNQEAILASWRRSRDYGVDPFLMRVSHTLKGEKLVALLKQNETLIEICKPFMEILYSYVNGSGFSVVLFDATAHLLSVIGDDDIIRDHLRGGYVAGSCWSEQSMGTNGVGTALAEDLPIQVCACEHFCRIAHRYSCSTAPIHDPDRHIIGGINMTGLYEKVTPHTLGAVVAAAQAIENELRRQQALQEVTEAYDLQQAIFESSQDAKIAIARDKTVKLVNEKAKRLLHLPHDVVGKKLKDVFAEKENNLFVRELLSGAPLVDREYTVSRGTDRYKFTVSSTPIDAAMEKARGSIVSLREIQRTRKLVTHTIGAKAKFHFKDIVGTDPRFCMTLEMGKKAAESASNVLLLGESGSGKDIFAQAIHHSSPRRSGPYIAINCGAIPRELITSELFGYTEGAFTGSRKGGSPGKFELADGGTIFLDEIGEMPLELQIVLLRVIEERSVTRIGGKMTMPFDVRIIAATNKNLREEVSKGNFREDLYFRLNVFTIEMIPLRARKNDIPLLAESIISRLNDSLGTRIHEIDPRVMDALMGYEWPGNVRELQNVIERMLNLAPGGKLTPDLLPMELFSARKPVTHALEHMDLEAFERMRISDMLQSNLSKNEIARQLKIARSTLYLKMKKYGLDHGA
jgi:transcriptional regulator of acetoin/glycerol metabolism